MVAMKEVQLALETNIEILGEEYEILIGYVRGMGGSMYEVICNVKGIDMSLFEEMKASWDPH